MPPRLGYKKSRRGCLRCKQRRVKCDENQPCSACARHGVKCEFAEEKPPGRKQAARSLSVASSESTSPMDIASQNAAGSPASIPPDHSQHLASGGLMPVVAANSPGIASWMTSSPTLTSDQFPYFDKFITSSKSVEQGSWLTDLELMHHYTSCTYATLPRASKLRQVWQTEVPKLALSHIFLLHQVLAVAAHHQSHLQPDRYSHYSICASLHQNKAIAGLRTALAQIKEDTCHEVFLASSLLTINAFAAFSDYGKVNDEPKLEDLLDVFQLTRGMSRILDSYTYMLHQGALGGMFFQEGGSGHDLFVSSVMDHLQQIDIPDTIHPSEASMCRQAIEGVLQWAGFAMAATGSPALRVSLSFVISLSEEFMDLVRRNHPIALLVISHYCVALHETGKHNWYLKGWGRSIVTNIMTVLDPSWATAMEWPLMMTEH